jgi:hypothetical protein
MPSRRTLRPPIHYLWFCTSAAHAQIPFRILTNPCSPHPDFLLSPSRPRSMSCLASPTSHSTRIQTGTSPVPLTGRRQSRPCVLAHSAIGGQQPRSRNIPSRATTGTSGANTNMHGMGMGSSGAPSMESPRYSGSGPRPPNGPGRAGARRPTYAQGSLMRVNLSLLPPSLWMSPLQTWVS